MPPHASGARLLPYNERRLVMNEARGVRERPAACDKPKGKLSVD